MKILFLTDLWLPFPGGAERYVVNVARELRERGHKDIHVLTSYEKAEGTLFDPELLFILGAHTTYTKDIRIQALKEKLEEIKPNIIFVHRFFAQEYSQFLSSLRPNTKIIEIVHQTRYIFDADFTIYNSEYTREHNNFAGPYEVIIPPVWEQDVLAQNKEDNRIGFVKPIEGKGVGTFYAIAEKMPDQKFLVLRGEWKSIEDYRPHMPNVKFIEPVKEMKEFYNQCDIVLVPSISEDAGTIPQEAAFNRLPCISSRVMGLTETNAGGIIVSHNYLECWIEELKSLLQTPFMRQRVGQRAWESLSKFRWKEKFDSLSARLNDWDK
jgi:glycosyltransferase involved in cell wall biosynthesis